MMSWQRPSPVPLIVSGDDHSLLQDWFDAMVAALRVTLGVSRSKVRKQSQRCADFADYADCRAGRSLQERPHKASKRSRFMFPKRWLARSPEGPRHPRRRQVEALRRAVGCAKPPKPYGAEVLHIDDAGQASRRNVRLTNALRRNMERTPGPAGRAMCKTSQTLPRGGFAHRRMEPRPTTRLEMGPLTGENVRNEPNGPIFRRKSICLSVLRHGFLVNLRTVVRTTVHFVRRINCR
jgi:hypothetical protein